MPRSSKDGWDKRDFSEALHRKGKWQTKISLTRFTPIRALWNYCSYKRSGVDTLAQKSKKSKVVLDLGSGNCAYTHWFLGKNNAPLIVASDWSFTALKSAPPPKGGKLLKVCADAHCLPFKSECFDTLFSIDTLGHVESINSVLDELARVSQNKANIFLHSECSDYKKIWPDRSLIRNIGRDILADHDGHFSLIPSSQLYTLYSRRFNVLKFTNPAGLLGWLLGYPEKYRLAFKRAEKPFLLMVTTLFSWIKKVPLLRALLKIVNATTNHGELFLGLSGGGSCFAELKKYSSASSKN